MIYDEYEPAILYYKEAEEIISRINSIEDVAIEEDKLYTKEKQRVKEFKNRILIERLEMIKIIKEGNLPINLIHNITCPYCKSELEYLDSDVKEEINKTTWIKINHKYYIICLFCYYKIYINKRKVLIPSKYLKLK